MKHCALVCLPPTKKLKKMRTFHFRMKHFRFIPVTFQLKIKTIFSEIFVYFPKNLRKVSSKSFENHKVELPNFCFRYHFLFIKLLLDIRIF